MQIPKLLTLAHYYNLVFRPQFNCANWDSWITFSCHTSTPSVWNNSSVFSWLSWPWHENYRQLFCRISLTYGFSGVASWLDSDYASNSWLFLFWRKTWRVLSSISQNQVRDGIFFFNGQKLRQDTSPKNRYNWLVDMHRKKSSLIMRKMQIKIIMQYHL